MLRKLFLFTLVGLIGGCVTAIKNPNDVRRSFVQIAKSVEIKVCGENDFSKSNECKTLMTLNSTGSGAVVWNEYLIGKTPRTLILTADHVCFDEMPKLSDFDIQAHIHIKENMGFKKEVELVSTPKMIAISSHGKGYKIKPKPWARNVVADTCILETSMNAPSLQIGTKPNYGEEVINIAAPSGIYYPNSSGGGVFYTDGFYNGDFIMEVPDKRMFSMYNIQAAPGSSGSPILNKNGEVVGMIHSVDSRYCSPLTGHCNSPISYSATFEQVKETLAAALAAIKRGDGITFDYRKVYQ